MLRRIACLLAVPLWFACAAAQAQQPPPSKPPAAAGPAPVLPVVRLIATGGTIAMKIDPVKKAPVPAISGEDLIATVPEIQKVARVEVQNLANVPSDYMDPDRWIQLQKAVSESLARPEVAGVIVSHGTDTLEETAWFLDLTVDSEKPVVLIGAQRNASEKDFDGPRNLLNAARICVAPSARRMGSMIALNNQINAAREAVKTHTSDVETFKSGDFGFLGVADNDRVIFYRAPLRRQHVALRVPEGQHLPRVDIVDMYGGADGALVRAAAAAGSKGLVIQALGWGNMNIPMFDAVKEVIAKGIPVVITTRVWNGRVLPNYGFQGGGKTLQDAGAIFGDNLSPQKARILLMLALQTTSNAQEIQKLFDR
ncbi:MAG TPA: asparaginase [Myxococcales bacterium]|nr:asparaginase [Myxococcales bacterium]